jgi:uncharacterized SAM-binding protein YcdF (DUF218 family)
VRAGRKKLVCGAGLVSTLLFLLALGAYYRAPALLTVDSGKCNAGAMVVLGGDPIGRPLRAAELFDEGAAPVVIVSGDGDNEEVARALMARGVPASAILREAKSGSTEQNAEMSVAVLKSRGITSAIIVTSWFHSRRALQTFRKVAPEITFYSRPSSYALSRAEWSRTGTSAHIRAEYLKLAGYWVCYGVCPI